MIIIDETQISVGLLCDIFMELGYEPLYRGYTDEEKEKIIANIKAEPVLNEKDKQRMEAAIKVAKNMRLLDYERMVDKYLGELAVQDNPMQHERRIEMIKMIENFEKLPRTEGCTTIPVINQIVRIEAKDDRGNVVFAIEGKDINIVVEREELGYHYY